MPRVQFFQGDTLLPMKVVREKTGLGVTSIYDRMAKGTFPQSIHLSPRCVRWSRLEIDDWIDALKEQRLAKPEAKAGSDAEMTAPSHQR